ncbi:MAG TPA: hypothetical protein VG847_07015 [Chitinophagaceae bacterium]|nr:hypothetical protein [Chitinophagaceae bacterium]
MAHTDTYKTDCRQCSSPAYYYPVELLIEPRTYTTAKAKTKNKHTKKTVSCTCTGEKDPKNTKHTLDYTFPDDFEKQ